jgi:hypothetical protein
MTSFESVTQDRRQGATGDQDVIQDALVAIRNHLGMEVAYSPSSWTDEPSSVGSMLRGWST